MPSPAAARAPAAWAVLFDEPVPYGAALRAQEAVHAARVAGRIPDTLLVLQHAPVVTLGRRGRTEHLLRSPAELAAAGVELFRASRGGDVTYHGPGQWVLYPILRLGSGGADAHGHLANLEETALRTAADFGVPAFRRAGMSGAWTAQGKIAAIGFLLRRRVTLHGMSFNVDVDLSGFGAMVPCGLEGETVASLASILGARCPARAAVRARLVARFGEVTGRALEVFEPGDALPAALAPLVAAAGRPAGG